MTKVHVVVLTILLAFGQLQSSLAKLTDTKWCTKSFETNSSYLKDDAAVMWFFSDLHSDYQMVKLANFSNEVIKGPAENENAALSIKTYELQKEFYGVGGSLPQSSAFLLLKLKNKECERYWKLLHSWFSCKEYDHSSCFNMLTLPISADDFITSSTPWTYDDVRNDTDFDHMNVYAQAKDQIWVLKDILLLNPHLKILAVPHSAPLWMKTLAPGEAWSSWYTGTLKEGMEEIYAKYLAQVVEHFTTMMFQEEEEEEEPESVEGEVSGGASLESTQIHFYAISLQHDPIQPAQAQSSTNSSTPPESTPKSPAHDKPRMYLSNTQQIKLAGYLRTELDKTSAKKTKILGFEGDWEEHKQAEDIRAKDKLDNKRTIHGLHPPGYQPPEGVIDSYGFHCYHGGPSQMSDFKEAAGDDVDILMTECSGYGSSNVLQNLPWSVNNLYIQATQNGAQSIMHGVLALDEDGGPNIAGHSKHRPVVTVADDFKITFKNEEHLGLTHWAKNVHPGAKAMGSTMDGGWGCVNGMAFLNLDSSIVVPVANWCSTKQYFSVDFDEKFHWDGDIPVGISTIIFKAGSIPIAKSAASATGSQASNWSDSPVLVILGLVIVMFPGLLVVIRMHRSRVPSPGALRPQKRFADEVVDRKAELMPLSDINAASL